MVHEGIILCCSVVCFSFSVIVHSCQHTVSNVKGYLCVFCLFFLTSDDFCILHSFFFLPAAVKRGISETRHPRFQPCFHLKAHTRLVSTLCVLRQTPSQSIVRPPPPPFSSESTPPVLCLPMVILRFTKRAALSHLPF